MEQENMLLLLKRAANYKDSSGREISAIADLVLKYGEPLYLKDLSILLIGNGQTSVKNLISAKKYFANLNGLFNNTTLMNPDLYGATFYDDETVTPVKPTTYVKDIAIDTNDNTVANTNFVHDLIDSKNYSSVSGTLDGANWKTITINNTTGNLVTSVPTEYVKTAESTGKTLLLTRSDGSTLQFSGSGGKFISYVGTGELSKELIFDNNIPSYLRFVGAGYNVPGEQGYAIDKTTTTTTTASGSTSMTGYKTCGAFNTETGTWPLSNKDTKTYASMNSTSPRTVLYNFDSANHKLTAVDCTKIERDERDSYFYSSGSSEECSESQYNSAYSSSSAMEREHPASSNYGNTYYVQGSTGGPGSWQHERTIVLGGHESYNTPCGELTSTGQTSITCTEGNVEREYSLTEIGDTRTEIDISVRQLATYHRVPYTGDKSTTTVETATVSTTTTTTKYIQKEALLSFATNGFEKFYEADTHDAGFFTGTFVDISKIKEATLLQDGSQVYFGTVTADGYPKKVYMHKDTANRKIGWGSVDGGAENVYNSAGITYYWEIIE